jgi:capsular polysaccharide biosynthesis protein
MLGRFTSPTMSGIDAQLPGALRSRRRRRTLVVLADSGRELAALKIDKSPWGKSTVVPMTDLTADELHSRLAPLSRVDLVVDARRSSGNKQLAALELDFFHVDPGGAWVALRRRGPVRWREPVVRVARGIQKSHTHRGVHKRWREHARSVADVRISRGVVVLAKRKKQHRLGVREIEAPVLLPTRERRLQVTELTRLEAGTIDPAGRVYDYGAVPDLRLPDVIEYPEHSVWAYDGVVQLPRGPIAYHRRTLLPDSFRWHLAPELKIRFVPRFGEQFFRVKEPKSSTRLPGAYYNFLYGHPGHFGHLMTEALAKLWGWWPAKEADPSLKILCRRQPNKTTPGLETILLPAFGIAPEDTVWVDGGVSVERLVGATPMWHNTAPFYAHPGIRDTWNRLRTGLIGSEPVDGASRIFVTRTHGNRSCRNVAEVEQYFADRGFEIVVPQELSVADQVRTFAGARVVAGFGGAGMFNLIYAQSLETVIVLNQSAYSARNEHLIAAVHGADIHTFWSRPEIDHPPGEHSYQAHQSAWSFDFGLNGDELGELLEREARTG